MPNGRLFSNVPFVEDILTGKFDARKTRLSLFYKISQRLFTKLLRVSISCNYNHPPKIKTKLFSFCSACPIIILVLN